MLDAYFPETGRITTGPRQNKTPESKVSTDEAATLRTHGHWRTRRKQNNGVEQRTADSLSGSVTVNYFIICTYKKTKEQGHTWTRTNG